MKLFVIILTFCTFVSNAQKSTNMHTPKDAKENFEKFIAKEKFVKENHYPGIGIEKLKPILTDKINLAAKDFLFVSQMEKPTDSIYLEKIAIGTKRFSDVYLDIDTEDRERICGYFMELMDIVELQSSNGLLMKFMYNIRLE